MRALLVIDVQNDFMPTGSLPVVDGDAVVPVANALMPHFALVVATQDWHPANHGSFAINHAGHVPGDVIELGGVPQVLWPPHCVQDAAGASFHSGLDVAGIDHVVRKGTDPGIDSYSGFYDNRHLKATGLDSYLRERRVDAVVIIGLATDYCVRATVFDALELEYAVTLVGDGVRAVDVASGDGERAIKEMRAAGAAVARAAEVPVA